MSLIQKTAINNACFFIHIPEINFKLLCSAPEDIVKHLRKIGIIKATSKDGVDFEDGPNAVLLADTSMQNGCLCNLSEFPILHMLYLQGMIIPNHPNNNGEKPLILGSIKQTSSHIDYIYLGNYGITDEQQMLDIGLSKKDVKKYIAMKKAFAFGSFKESDELLDFLHIEEGSKQIKENLSIKRESRNVFTLTYKNESMLIDLNLKKNEVYYAPYNLGYYKTKLEHFAVTHIGNGDGWNMDEPSMSSVLFNNGRIYLIDAGPNIAYLLDRLSISINGISGVFMTHVHDDHFCGLLSLMESDKKMTIYAIGLVRESVIAKLSNALNVPKNMVSNFVDFVDLKLDTWNNISSLEVKPMISPHPIETTIFYFKKMTKDGYKTYGHLADLASFDAIDNLAKPYKNDEDDENKEMFDFYQNMKKNCLMPVDLKKIDAGGGLIHGKVSDFKDDKTKKIIIAHKNTRATTEETSIASETFFGSVDILDVSHINYDINNVYKILNDYFHGYSLNYTDNIVNNEIINFNPGNIIAKKGDIVQDVYITLKGNANTIQNDGSVTFVSSGSFLREYILFSKKVRDIDKYKLSFTDITDSSVHKKTHIARSFVSALKIPKHIFNKFISVSLSEYKKVDKIDFQDFIQKTSLFGNSISSKTMNNIVENMKIHTFGKDTTLHDKLTANSIFFIYSGSVHVRFCNNKPNALNSGDFFGIEESVFSFLNIENISITSSQAVLLEMQVDVLMDSPIIYRKILEEYINHKNYIYSYVSKNISNEEDEIIFSENIEVKYKIIMEKVYTFQYMYDRLEEKDLIENFMRNMLKYLKIYSDEVELILIRDSKFKDVFRFVRKDVKSIISVLSDDLDKLNKNITKYENIGNIVVSLKALLYEHKKTLYEKLLRVKNDSI